MKGVKWRLRCMGAKKTFKWSKYDYCNTAENSFAKKLITYSITYVTFFLNQCMN